MGKTELRNLGSSIIFPLGQKIENEYFRGTVWVETLVSNDSVFNCPIYNVTFEPGARNNWHKHPGGQILLVTGGRGYYQEEGRPVQIIKEGDVVKIQPDVKHWHGRQCPGRAGSGTFLLGSDGTGNRMWLPRKFWPV